MDFRRIWRGSAMLGGSAIGTLSTLAYLAYAGETAIPKNVPAYLSAQCRDMQAQQKQAHNVLGKAFATYTDAWFARSKAEYAPQPDAKELAKLKHQEEATHESYLTARDEAFSLDDDADSMGCTVPPGVTVHPDITPKPQQAPAPEAKPAPARPHLSDEYIEVCALQLSNAILKVEGIRTRLFNTDSKDVDKIKELRSQLGVANAQAAMAQQKCNAVKAQQKTAPEGR